MTTEHATFVAEARRVYEPAARWIRENADWDRLRLQRWDRSIAIHLQWGWHMGVRYEEMIVVRPEPPTRETFAPTSLTQAVDYLVTAGVLPVEFHSLAPETEPSEVCPRCQHGVTWHEEEGCSEDCPCPLPGRAARWLAHQAGQRREVALAEVNRVAGSVAR